MAEELKLVAGVVAAGLALGAAAGCSEMAWSGGGSSEGTAIHLDEAASGGSESSSIGDFDTVENQTSVNIVYTQDGGPSAKVQGDPADVKQIVLRMSGRKLIVTSVNNAHIHGTVTVRLASRSLKAFTLAGSGDCALNSLKGDGLKADLNGSGNISASGSVHGLTVNLAGSGNVKVDGLHTGNASVEIGGSGNVRVNANDSVSVDVNGSGSVWVGSPAKLAVNINGSGDVHYHGNPSVTQSINGSGSIHHE
jgi:hypothetical protein